MTPSSVKTRPAPGVKTAALRAAWPKTLPVLAGYLFIGMAFGVLLTSAGWHPLWAVVMSVFIYAGSMQFVTVGMLAAGADLPTAAAMTAMVNLRHLFYGLPMLRRFAAAGAKKIYLALGLTDETFSLLCGTRAPDGVDPGWYDFFITLLDQCYWVLGSALGAVAGSLLPFNTTGIDFAMTALFVVVFIDQLRERQNRLPAVIGLSGSAACLLLFGADGFLLPAMALMVLLLCFLRGRAIADRGEEHAP